MTPTDVRAVLDHTPNEHGLGALDALRKASGLPALTDPESLRRRAANYRRAGFSNRADALEAQLELLEATP